MPLKNAASFDLPPFMAVGSTKAMFCVLQKSQLVNVYGGTFTSTTSQCCMHFFTPVAKAPNETASKVDSQSALADMYNTFPYRTEPQGSDTLFNYFINKEKERLT